MKVRLYLRPTGSEVLISKYGYDVVRTVVAIVVIGSLLSWFLVEGPVLRLGLLAIFLLILVFTLAFFRDPRRNTPQGDNMIIAPADGKVLQIKALREEEYLRSEAVQVSIFMSPFNVHVNRFPVSGTVGYYRYFPGEFLVAFDEKASLRNERTHIGVENGHGKVLFKQVAGFVARRIVARVSEGDRATAGERFGMIKFGSRVDVIMRDDAELKVKPGDRTVAGETVLAVVS